MVNVSPGIYTREIDQSQFQETQSTTNVVIIGPATKGPFNELTLVTNALEQINVFGKPNGSHLGVYAALEFLKQGRSLKFIRVGDGDEAPATVQINGLAQVPYYMSGLDISRGVDLSGARKKLNLTIDGETLEIDVSVGATDLTNVTIDEIIANIVDAYDSLSPSVAVNVGKDRFGRFIKIWGSVTGASEEIIIDDTGTPSENAAQVVFGEFSFPQTINGLDANANALVINYISDGTEGNNTKVVITKSDLDTDVFKITVIGENNIALEVFDELSADAVSVAAVNTASKYIQLVLPSTPTGLPPAPMLFGPSPSVTPITYFLVGGHNGDANLDAADYIGVTTATATTGMRLLDDFESVEADILAIPDSVNLNAANHAAVVLNMLDTASNRGDMLSIIDPPKNLNTTQVVQWHNGQGAFNTHQAFNSSYGCLYHDWLRTFDPFTRETVEIPPSGFVLSKMAFTDTVSFPWFATAGITRGRIGTALSIMSNPTLGQRDFMYSSGNAVNPIVNRPQDGIVIWGQRTLQRNASALNRINVRRLLNIIRKTVRKATVSALFEQNDLETRDLLKILISPILENATRNRGIEKYKIVCDTSNNSEDDIANNRLNCSVFIIPTKTAEIINIDFIIKRTGAEFSEGSNQLV